MTLRRPSIPTPPGRPVEAGWLQEIGRWLWHLVVLPAHEAGVWPAWMHAYVKPLVCRAAGALQVSNPLSLRSWLWSVLLVNPPPAYWVNRERYQQRGHNQPTTLNGLLRRAVRPYAAPVLSACAAAIDQYAHSIFRVYARANTVTRVATISVLLAALIIVASTPLDLSEQLIVLVTMWAATLLIRNVPGYGPGLIMIAFSIIASSRYIWWRTTQTTHVGSGVEWFFGIGLLAAEFYTWTVLALGYIQNARPLERKPVALPADRSLWPTVDIYIPSYNEPLKVVKPTVLAALGLDWPAEKLNVYVLDDGRRAEFREFAVRYGAKYLTRPNNFHAKAGNLNHALKITNGQFIAIFDCDHIPVRTFLTTTMGWFLQDPNCAMIQTPHHFFSPDPFERNLGTFRRVPNEGNLFYGLIQDGNDFWNAAFFCGSCAVLRRGPLEEVGGIAVETVTEDAHTALKMHRRGYTTAYLRKTLAGGLATESLSGHIGQRIRWARGMAQIFRLDNPFTGKGLNFFQRLCYSNAMLHFFSGIPRLVFLTAPLAYLYFQFHIINAAAVTLTVYAVPHLVQSSLANSRLQGRFRHSFWNEAYEAVLCWYITLPTMVALINPRLGKFNVTAKGGLVEFDFFDWRISAPYVVLVLLNVGGALIAIPRLFLWNSYEADTVAVNLIWTLFNLTLLGAVLGVATETRQVRTAHRVAENIPAMLFLSDGRNLACETEDFSMGGVGIRTNMASEIRLADRVHFGLSCDGQRFRFPAEVAVTGRNHVGLTLGAMSIQEEKDYVRCTFARPDTWTDWDDATELDRPLASFAEVFSFGATGYVRLLESIYSGIMTRLRPAPAPPAVAT